MAVGSTSAAESGAIAGDSAAGVSGRAGCSSNCGDVQADNSDVAIARVAANSRLVFRIFVVPPVGSAAASLRLLFSTDEGNNSPGNLPEPACDARRFILNTFCERKIYWCQFRFVAY
jgi:hypothetical protein